VIVDDLAALAAPIDKLNLLPGNPRRGDVDAVAQSLTAFGQRKPIVARRDGTVIAGNHTLQAARQLGWPEIAVVWVDDNDTTAKAFALADNRTAELGTYDDQLLADLIAEVRDADPDLLAASGWTEAATKELLDAIAAAEPPPTITGDPNEVPKSAPAKTIPGDVWLLGPHRLVCGDSTVPTDVDKLMAGGKADMVWTDPPYGIGYEAMRGGAAIANDATPSEALSVTTEALRIIGSPESVFVCCDWRSLPTIVDAMTAAGLTPKACIVWDKKVRVQNLDRFAKRHEMIVYAGPYGGHPTVDTDVWEVSRDFNPDHPTPKPVELVQRAISHASAPGSIVLDLFGGSGSTLIAAHQTGRIARLMELDPKYCDVICARFQKATGIKPIAEATNNEHDFLEADDGVAAREAT
jgi:site-specific DNA-methyltransferase (adenine-specific)